MVKWTWKFFVEIENKERKNFLLNMYTYRKLKKILIADLNQDFIIRTYVQ